jgi:16S rRNA (cytosine1402-N4)-methyltransferase
MVVHDPVLLKEVVEFLRPVDEEGILVDATLGLGGHAEGLLKQYPRVAVLGIDRDPQALTQSRARLAPFGERVRIREGRYEMFIEILDAERIEKVDGTLADLGVSSLQLDDPQRGFSFRREGPLDMRMSAEGPTAADLVNGLDEQELVRILREYGEEPMARRIARAIIEARPLQTTTQLAEVVRSVKRRNPRGDKIDPATLTFQGLRIATNEELVGLEKFVSDVVGRLKTGARIGVISFHSLEDRVIKRAFRRLEGECICPPRMPFCRCGARQVVKILTKRPIEAQQEEVSRNPRARSAKLRVAEKVISD